MNYIQACKQYNLTPTKGRKHSVIINQYEYGYQELKGHTIDCRQFYENYAGLVYVDSTGVLQTIDKSTLTLGSITRITPTGERAYQVTVHI